MTVVISRPGPSPTDRARIARRIGGVRNETNQAESEKTELLPSSSTSVSKSGVVSNVPASTGTIGGTVDSGEIQHPAMAHAQSIAASKPALDPNGPLPAAGKPAVAHKKAATAKPAAAPATAQSHQTHPQRPAGTETAPDFAHAHTAGSDDPLA